MKVLIISNNSFSKTANNGKTLCSIFSEFKSSDIAQLYFGENESPYEEFCDNYYRVTELDILNSILNLSFTTSSSHNKLVSALRNDTHKEPKWFSTLKKYNKKLSLIRETIWCFKTWDSPSLNRWIEDFKPDAIFALLGSNIYVHNIAVYLSEKYKLPLFVYFTDDYVINSTAKGIVERIHYRLLCNQYKKTVSKACKSYAIGEKMQKDYSIMYGKPFGVLGNSIDMTKYSHIMPVTLKNDEPIIISYMGGLHSGRWKSISELGGLIKEINERYHYKVRIKVFSAAEPSKEMQTSFAESGVEYCGSLDSAGVIKQMENSHFLLHVESFGKMDRTYVKYSVSTKISEYLSSNRMVMAYGPHEVASMQLLCNNRLGCCFTDLDTKEGILGKISAAIQNYNSYNHSLPKQYVMDNYDKTIMSQRLIEDMRKALHDVELSK